MDIIKINFYDERHNTVDLPNSIYILVAFKKLVDRKLNIIKKK